MIVRNENESEEQFLWRIGQLKDSGVLNMSWDEIASFMNKTFREDESEYRTEAAYRKPYQQAKRFFDSGIFSNRDDTYIAELQTEKQEIRKEKQKLFDERTALNKTLREQARMEEDLSKLEELIKSNNVNMPPVNHGFADGSDNDMIIALSDFHLGLDTNNRFGVYNSEIAETRLAQYAEEIVNIRDIHNSENAYVILLGDAISGEIHLTTQLENRENAVAQVQKASELISKFVYELSKHFNTVYVNGVAGNHSRTGMKDEVLRNNRLDDLIPWYMKARLAHIPNVEFIDVYNIDSTIGYCEVRGNQYIAVHGDFDSFSEKGVSRLVMMLEFKPEAIFYGHLHRCSYDEISGVKIIRSGSFCGSSDDYTISKRLSGRPSQMVCIADSNGVKACYPIKLD